MIGELLQPDFLKERGDEVIAALDHHAKNLDSAKSEVQQVAREEEVDAADLKRAQAVLKSLVKEPFLKEEREAAWLPRDPYLWILQAELDRFYERAHAADDRTAVGLVGGFSEVTG